MINDTQVYQFDTVQFNVTWSDNGELNYSVFSTNASGSWINSSAVAFGEGFVSTNVSFITADSGSVIEARKKIAKALVEGKAIKIHGGVFKMPGEDMTGPAGQGPMPGRGGGRGRGQGAGGGQGYGGPTTCKCPQCGKEVPHIRGQPCVKQKCPQCSSMMIRGI